MRAKRVRVALRVLWLALRGKIADADDDCTEHGLVGYRMIAFTVREEDWR